MAAEDEAPAESNQTTETISVVAIFHGMFLCYEALILGLWHHLWMCYMKKATEAWLLQRRSNHNKFKNPVMDAAYMYLLLYHSTAASPAQRPVQRPTVSLVQWLEDLVNVLNLILSAPVSTTTHACCLSVFVFVPRKPLDCVLHDVCSAYMLWRPGVLFDMLTWACAIQD